jgi:MGT family glycosyltransferase
MRVIIPVWGGQAHVQPLIPLARALEAAGDQTRITCRMGLAPFVEAAGLTAVPLYDDTAFPTEPGDLARAARIQLARLMEFAKGWQPDVVVREWAELAGLVLAGEHGVPCVVCGVKMRPAPQTGGSHPCMALMQTGVEQVLIGRQAGDDGLSIDLATVASRHARVTRQHDGKVDAKLNFTGLFGDLFLSLYPPALALPGTAPLPGEHHFQPPIFDTADTDRRPPDWFDRLTDRPIVLATLGTTVNGLSGVFRSIIDAAADLPVHLVVTLGENGDADGLGPLPDNAHLAGYLPLSAVMHRCAAAITHGGFNTVMTALTFGVPLVCIPVNGDQPVNARRCVELGAGLALPTEDVDPLGMREPQVDPRQVRAMLLRLLTEPGFAQAARRIADEIRGLPSVDQAVPLIHDLVAATGSPR